MNGALAFAFQQIAQLKRAQLHVDVAALRPSSAQQHVDVAVPGFVGPDYQSGGTCLLSINPAGGKDGYVPTKSDRLIYDAAATLASTNSDRAGEDLARLGEAFVAAMPSWGSQWRHVSAILEATGTPLTAIAYVYVLPFRTRDDAGSRLPKPILQAANRQGFYDLLNNLKAGRIIAMDRPSYDSAASWVGKGQHKAHVLYYTRKRDDHAGRATMLDQLRVSGTLSAS